TSLAGESCKGELRPTGLNSLQSSTLSSFNLLGHHQVSHQQGSHTRTGGRGIRPSCPVSSWLSLLSSLPNDAAGPTKLSPLHDEPTRNTSSAFCNRLQFSSSCTH
ncbi:mCG1036564, partial [Mus musculus]